MSGAVNLLVAFGASGFLLALMVATVERVTVWEVLGRALRSVWMGCRALGAALMPSLRARRPVARSLGFCEREFLEGRIDVEEFERRVDAALRNGSRE